MDLSGATILLTGGTGSFGHAFVERIVTTFPDTTVRVFSRDELKQSEMQRRYDTNQVRWMLGDVRNRSRMTRAVQGCDFVVHAAAMKQVPACEYNPFESVQTNILGAQHVVDAAIDSGVRKVVALSTDKAVNPVNTYGATKLAAEKIFVQGNAYAQGTETALACVRYGNVVGSRGSVVPAFRRQAEENGVLTITDPRMTRFWITLEQAVDLVLTAIDESVGGEIFVPKIPSMRVTDLAEAIAPGVPHEHVGIRPGEKLHETLLTAEEARNTVDNGRNYVVLPQIAFWSGLEERWADAKPVDEGFEYASHTNDEWLSVDDLKALIDS